MKVQSYRDLQVWQKYLDFAVECYQLASRFPKFETYGLCSQLQRASVSISSNIAEGAGRDYTKEYLHHLSTAKGSLYECETQIMIAQRVDYFPEAEQNRLLMITGEIGRMLHGLINALERKLS